MLESKLLLEAKKARSVQEQERDMLFRKLEIVRGDMIERDADLIVQARDMERGQYLQHSELKVT